MEKNIREFLVALGTIAIAVIITFTIGFFVGTNYYPNIKVVGNNITNTITIEKQLQPIVNNYNNTISNYTYKTTYFESKSEFLNILKENYEYKDYDLNNYNCIDFTDRGYNKLKESGYLVDKLSTYIKDKNVYHAFGGVYNFVDFTTGEIIPPSKYGYFGIDAGLLREWNSTKSDQYKEQEDLSKDSFQICRGLK